MSARLPRKKYTTKPAKKRTTSRKKTISKLSKLFISIFVLIISVGLISGTFWINRLNKQLVGAESANSIDSNYHTILYAVVNDFNSSNPLIKSLDFVVVDTTGKKINYYELNPDYSINLGPKYGEVPVNKLFSLGLLQGEQTKQEAIKFVNSSIFDLFAFKVDRFIFVDTTESSIFDSFIENGAYLPLLTRFTVNKDTEQFKLNLSFDEIYQFSKLVTELPSDRILKSNLAESDFNLIDKNLQEMTIDSQFALDAKNIAVMNGGDKAGVAGFGSRVIKNLGGRVVSIVNANEKFGENFIVSDFSDDLSTKTLMSTFGITKVLTKSQAETLLNSNDLYRADILVVLID